MNAKRTVRGYARAGFAGVLMEDQVAPKACGHTRNRRVIPRPDAVARVRAACDERDEGPSGDCVIFARSDARSAADEKLTTTRNAGNPAAGGLPGVPKTRDTGRADRRFWVRDASFLPTNMLTVPFAANRIFGQ